MTGLNLKDFALKWIDKFSDPKISYMALIDHHMEDDCETLGFQMDWGKDFEGAYGKAVNNAEELEKIIEDVTDILLLRSAIYSQWKYFNHRAYHGGEILEPENLSDAKAIVIKNAEGVKVGYVPREDNVIFSRLMDAGKLLFGKITHKEMKGKWLKIDIKIYLHE